jgi:hypothetical protein
MFCGLCTKSILSSVSLPIPQSSGSSSSGSLSLGSSASSSSNQDSQASAPVLEVLADPTLLDVSLDALKKTVLDAAEKVEKVINDSINDSSLKLAEIKKETEEIVTDTIKEVDLAITQTKPESVISREALTRGALTQDSTPATKWPSVLIDKEIKIDYFNVLDPNSLPKPKLSRLPSLPKSPRR